MTEIRCVIIEDQLPAQKILIRYIEDLPELKLLTTFTNAVEAVSYLKKEKVDLIFLDIHLPKLSGLDFLKILPDRPKIILTTAYTDYALEGFELDVVDYLVKPISLERFIRAINKVNPSYASQAGLDPRDEYIEEEKPDSYIFVKDGREILKIFFDRIICIKASGDFVELITLDKKYLIAYTMKYWEELLSPKNFCRVHKSYIINLQKIDKIYGNSIYMQDHTIPIGRSHRQAFFKRININS
ncbi:LytTR family DNA-binding domain-containing protein [Fulvivirgaceae bacterium BMA10]|uniref:LytTR family DNA-binding domain-containing protein n=1 Tax=Splendidivirga corallicola TaxID=3051826 RepID=A0ABT8KVV6_9BACT|nr:LytTR family DNA-binding domain-containing protein [Fulvivirgaceae bacterium BMA10]